MDELTRANIAIEEIRNCLNQLDAVSEMKLKEIDFDLYADIHQFSIRFREKLFQKGYLKVVFCPIDDE